MMLALVAMIGFNSCSEDCDHNFIEHDFTQDIVGTWTTLNGELAEAMVINPDGSFEVTGVTNGGNGSLYEEKGTIKVVNNKVTLAFDGDKETFEGRLEFVAGKSLSLVMFDDNDVRLTYDYCENDLSDEIIGMWVCNGGVLGQKGDINIQTFNTDGKAIFTGGLVTNEKEPFLNVESTYKVIGDMVFQKMAGDLIPDKYQIFQLTYAPDGTSAGDIMVQKMYLTTEKGSRVETVSSWLRVKQHLELPGNKYDYNNLYVSNVKGGDRDIEFMGQVFNFSEMDGVKLDKMLKSLLFSVEFPDANTIKYICHYNNQAAPAVVEAPITVDGNKITVKVSEVYPEFKDVELYTFQDQDNTQMHIYMPTHSFEAFFGNLLVMALSQKGELDKTDAAAVKAVHDRVDATVESINLSLIMKQAKK